MNKKPTVPAPSKVNLLRQICNFIPEFLVAKIARETKVDERARTFSPWSQVVALIYAQLTHSIGLNDVCDALRLQSGPLSSIRGATPPSRNNLSHADKVRPAEMAERLFWAVFEHLGELSPRFVSGTGRKRFAGKFKRLIHLVDSTTIPLVASCMDWARHRRRKAAAKCHLRLDLQSFLPHFAIVDTARHNDAKRARELCAGIKAGEIVIFDKAYVDFAHLADLCQRLVFWVTRAKDNLNYTVARRYQKGAVGKILRDDLIRLQTPASRKEYPEMMRRMVALVEVDGQEMEMVFLSNNLEWSAQPIRNFRSLAFGCALLVLSAPAGLLFYFIDLPLISATFKRSSLTVASRPAGSPSRDYHLLADAFMSSRRTGSASPRRARFPPHGTNIHQLLNDTSLFFIFFIKII
jgi:hypothetical protein